MENFKVTEVTYSDFSELIKGCEYAIEIDGMYFRFRYEPESNGIGGAFNIKPSKKNYITMLNPTLGKATLVRSDLKK